MQAALDAQRAALSAVGVFNQQQTAAGAAQGQHWSRGGACLTPPAGFGPARGAAIHSTTTTQTHLPLPFEQGVFDAATVMTAQEAVQPRPAFPSPATLAAVAARQQASLRTPLAGRGLSASQAPAPCAVPATKRPAAAAAAAAAVPAASPGLERSASPATGGAGGSAAVLRGTLSRNGSITSGAAGAVLQATSSMGLLSPTSSVLSEEAGPDRQATLSTLQALLWEAETSFHKAEESREQLRKQRWRLYDMKTGQLQGQLSLSDTQNIWAAGSAKGVFVVPEGANKPLRLEHALRGVANQNKEVADKLQQQHKLVRGHLEELRTLAGEPLRLSKFLQASAAADPERVWHIQLTATNQDTVGMNGQQLLAALAAAAQQYPPAATVELDAHSGNSSSSSFSLAAAQQLQQQPPQVQAMAQDWPNGPPDWQQLPEFADSTCCWHMHGDSGSNAGSSWAVSVTQLKQLLLDDRLPLVQLVYHAQDPQRRAVWVFDLVLKPVLSFDVGQVRKNARAAVGQQQQQQLPLQEQQRQQQLLLKAQQLQLQHKPQQEQQRQQQQQVRQVQQPPMLQEQRQQQEQQQERRQQHQQQPEQQLLQQQQPAGMQKREARTQQEVERLLQMPEQELREILSVQQLQQFRFEWEQMKCAAHGSASVAAAVRSYEVRRADGAHGSLSPGAGEQQAPQQQQQLAQQGAMQQLEQLAGLAHTLRQPLAGADAADQPDSSASPAVRSRPSAVHRTDVAQAALLGVEEQQQLPAQQQQQQKVSGKHAQPQQLLPDQQQGQARDQQLLREHQLAAMSDDAAQLLGRQQQEGQTARLQQQQLLEVAAAADRLQQQRKSPSPTQVQQRPQGVPERLMGQGGMQQQGHKQLMQGQHSPQSLNSSGVSLSPQQQQQQQQGTSSQGPSMQYTQMHLRQQALAEEEQRRRQQLLQQTPQQPSAKRQRQHMVAQKQLQSPLQQLLGTQCDGQQPQQQQQPPSPLQQPQQQQEVSWPAAGAFPSPVRQQREQFLRQQLAWQHKQQQLASPQGPQQQQHLMPLLRQNLLQQHAEQQATMQPQPQQQQQQQEEESLLGIQDEFQQFLLLVPEVLQGTSMQQQHEDQLLQRPASADQLAEWQAVGDGEREGAGGVGGGVGGVGDRLLLEPGTPPPAEQAGIDAPAEQAGMDADELEGIRAAAAEAAIAVAAAANAAVEAHNAALRASSPAGALGPVAAQQRQQTPSSLLAGLYPAQRTAESPAAALQADELQQQEAPPPPQQQQQQEAQQLEQQQETQQLEQQRLEQQQEAQQLEQLEQQQRQKEAQQLQEAQQHEAQQQQAMQSNDAEAPPPKRRRGRPKSSTSAAAATQPGALQEPLAARNTQGRQSAGRRQRAAPARRGKAQKQQPPPPTQQQEQQVQEQELPAAPVYGSATAVEEAVPELLVQQPAPQQQQAAVDGSVAAAEQAEPEVLVQQPAAGQQLPLQPHAAVDNSATATEEAVPDALAQQPALQQQQQPLQAAVDGSVAAAEQAELVVLVQQQAPQQQQQQRQAVVAGDATTAEQAAVELLVQQPPPEQQQLLLQALVDGGGTAVQQAQAETEVLVQQPALQQQQQQQQDPADAEAATAQQVVPEAQTQAGGQPDPPQQPPPQQQQQQQEPARADATTAQQLRPKRKLKIKFKNPQLNKRFRAQHPAADAPCSPAAAPASQTPHALAEHAIEVHSAAGVESLGLDGAQQQHHHQQQQEQEDERVVGEQLVCAAQQHQRLGEEEVPDAEQPVLVAQKQQQQQQQQREQQQGAPDQSMRSPRPLSLATLQQGAVNQGMCSPRPSPGRQQQRGALEQAVWSPRPSPGRQQLRGFPEQAAWSPRPSFTTHSSMSSDLPPFVPPQMRAGTAQQDPPDEDEVTQQPRAQQRPAEVAGASGRVVSPAPRAVGFDQAAAAEQPAAAPAALEGGVLIAPCAGLAQGEMRRAPWQVDPYDFPVSDDPEEAQGAAAGADEVLVRQESAAADIQQQRGLEPAPEQLGECAEAGGFCLGRESDAAGEQQQAPEPVPEQPVATPAAAPAASDGGQAGDGQAGDAVRSAGWDCEEEPGAAADDLLGGQEPAVAGDQQQHIPQPAALEQPAVDPAASYGGQEGKQPADAAQSAGRACGQGQGTGAGAACLCLTLQQEWQAWDDDEESSDLGADNGQCGPPAVGVGLAVASAGALVRPAVPSAAAAAAAAAVDPASDSEHEDDERPGDRLSSDWEYEGMQGSPCPEQPAAAAPVLAAWCAGVSLLHPNQKQQQQQEWAKQQQQQQQSEQDAAQSAGTVLRQAQRSRLQSHAASARLQLSQAVDVPSGADSCTPEREDSPATVAAAAAAAAAAAGGAVGSSSRGVKRQRQSQVRGEVMTAPNALAAAVADGAERPVRRARASTGAAAAAPAPAAAVRQGRPGQPRGRKAAKPSRKASAAAAAAVVTIEGCSRATGADTLRKMLIQRRQQQGYNSGLRQVLLRRERLAAPATAAAEVGVRYNRWGRYQSPHALPYSLLQPSWAAAAAAAKPPMAQKQLLPAVRHSSSSSSGGSLLAAANGSQRGSVRGCRQRNQQAADGQAAPPPKRVVWQRSSIHGAGLFAGERIAAGEFVIEYKGMLIRPVLEDLVEQRYEAQGQDSSYLFRIDKHRVADATVSGGLSRFINHSCNPNCFTKVFLVNGVARMGIYAKRPIELGEELAYDYKFDFEEGDRRVPCRCGAHNCRGYMN